MKRASRRPTRSPATRPRIAFIVTHSITANYLLRGQLAELRRRGFAISVIVAPGPDLDRVAERESVDIVPIPMNRSINVTGDLVALWRLVRALRAIRPQLVNASTPKAGLLGSVAAWLARIPVRVYTVRGLRLETARGPMRLALEISERIASAAATRIVCVSPSLAHEYQKRGFARKGKVSVLGTGSSNGVDTVRFQPGSGSSSARTEMAIASNAPVIGFAGRLTRDKGVMDLTETYFEHLRPKEPAAHLLLIGDFEQGDPVDDLVRDRLCEDPLVHVTGFRDDMPRFYHSIDVFVLPSYREGFPNAVLEASASGLPVVAYDAVGSRDAVQHEVTGFLVPVGDRNALASAVERYIADPELRRRHGEAGRLMVLEHFRQEVVWDAWADFYSANLPSSEASEKIAH